jgi:hypothetical protein
LFLGLGLVALIGTSCAHAAGPGVAVQKLDSNISFGLPKTGPAAAPTSVAPPDLTGPGNPLPAFVYATTTTFNFSGAQYNGGATSEQNPCPPAPFGASPAKSTSTSVPGPPKAGSYKWQVATSEAVPGSKYNITVKKYVTYYIDNVSKVTRTPNPAGGDTSTFTFDVVSPGQQGGTVTTTYQVKENAVQVAGSAGNVGQTQHAGAPDRGVSLAKVIDRDGAGKVTATFTPNPSVLLFPLDVQAPESFQAAGVDPTTGATFTNNATVTGQVKRVNACGQLVDGWDVTGSQTFSGSGSGSASASVEYAVATQYGGLLIFQSSTPTGSTNSETNQIGQLDPGPLPPGMS